MIAPRITLTVEGIERTVERMQKVISEAAKRASEECSLRGGDTIDVDVNLHLIIRESGEYDPSC